MIYLSTKICADVYYFFLNFFSIIDDDKFYRGDYIENEIFSIFHTIYKVIKCDAYGACEQIYLKVFGADHEETLDAAMRALTVGEEEEDEEGEEEDRLTVGRARRIERFLSQPFFVAEVFTGLSGKYVPLNNSVTGFQRILNGEFDTLPEQAFYLVGPIEDVIEKANTLAK